MSSNIRSDATNSDVKPLDTFPSDGGLMDHFIFTNIEAVDVRGACVDDEKFAEEQVRENIFQILDSDVWVRAVLPS